MFSRKPCTCRRASAISRDIRRNCYCKMLGLTLLYGSGRVNSLVKLTQLEILTSAIELELSRARDFVC